MSRSVVDEQPQSKSRTARKSEKNLILFNFNPPKKISALSVGKDADILNNALKSEERQALFLLPKSETDRIGQAFRLNSEAELR